MNPAMQADAMMAQSAGYPHQRQANHSYPSHHAAVNLSDGSEMYASQDAMMDGFYVPPQAPRLTAAAVRASSMAAMYYNPWLHPMHTFNSHARGSEPWIGAGRIDDMAQGTAPMMPHQDVGSQHLADYNATCSAASAYGQEQHQPGRYSYPDGKVGQSWRSERASEGRWRDGGNGHAGLTRAARHSSDMTPTSFAAYPNGSTFLGGSTQHARMLRQPVPAQYHRQSLQQRNTAQSQYDAHTAAQPYYAPAPATSGSTWHDHAAQPRWYNHSAAPSGYQSNWQQGGLAWGQSQDYASWPASNEVPDHAANVGASWPTQPPAMYAPQIQPVGPTSYASHAVAEQAYPVAPVNAAAPAAEDMAANVDPAAAAANDVKEAEKDHGVPPPTSPATLDKSGVPISSVAAELIWSACAAFMDPELMVTCSQRHAAGDSRRSSRERTPSGTSLHSSGTLSTCQTDTDWSMSPIQTSPQHRQQQRSQQMQTEGALPVLHPLHRLTLGSGETRTSSSEESSASSSEPGTPPSSFPAYLYDEMQRSGKASRPMERTRSFSTRDNQGLGLAASRHIGGVREHSMPPTLTRQDSFGQKQSAIVDVLCLISPGWKWSNYEEKLASLSTSVQPATSQDMAASVSMRSSLSGRKRQASANGTGVRGDDTNAPPSGVAAFGGESSPAFRRFAHQVLAQTLISPTALMLAVLFSLRVPYLAIEVDAHGIAHLDAEAREIFAQPASAAPFKLLTLGLMMANKHLDDNTFLNKTWNEVTGISLAEINRMERWFLERCSYEIVVPEVSWVMFLQRLGARTEGALAMHAEDERRARLPGSRHRTSHSMSSLRGQTKTLGGLTHDESLKRLLLCIEDALVLLGHMTAFRLSRAGSSSSQRKRHALASPLTGALPLQEPHPRPGHSLQGLHRQSLSAPLLTSQVVGAPPMESGDLDVFDEEDGPYRPQRCRHQSAVENRQDVEAILSKSSSQSSHTKEAEALMSWRESGAPLAPSVLLDLLNRGQQLAHATQ